MDSTFGFYLFQAVPITIDLPIRASTLITQSNDQDRDGCKDDLEGSGVSCDSYKNFTNTFPSDHDNDNSSDTYGFNVGNDLDADSDGVDWGEDTIAIGYTSGTSGTCDEGYYIFRPHNSSVGSTCSFSSLGHREISGWDEGIDVDGWYHAPEIWEDDSEALPGLYERQLPNKGLDSVNVIRILRTEHDRDNDGWIDKYDDDFDDPEEH
ncbi:MAG: hypothetical protein ABEJ65_00595 [bacterium]